MLCHCAGWGDGGGGVSFREGAFFAVGGVGERGEVRKRVSVPHLGEVAKVRAKTRFLVAEWGVNGLCCPNLE